ncbi:coproporphyrinogen-III oxidase 1, chloroplastic-like [Papaver somniferum]|uniref:coproporphyrinogen-III oxidase 1, chloroplastic-like n=1 Tax=Papaver somniferum TaxID=3469 RepID=UPI000E6FB479|nr:coproporphyrinogen-III oxidase 1, chloroplastic-like [Papaver somniferum]
MAATSTSTTSILYPIPSSSSSSSSLSAPSRSTISSSFFKRTSSPKPLTSINKTTTNSRRVVIRSAVAIEKETPESERPDTFLREIDDPSSSKASPHSSNVRAKFEKMIREAQDSVCAAVEAADGGATFKEDVWSRPGGGGGISRVLQDGNVWEKAGVNVSVVYGVMPPEAYRAAKGDNSTTTKPGPVPFFAAGISSVLHPKNPFAPTLHFNYRYFETDAPKDAPGAPRSWWFGGGTDLTPAYIFEEDVKHFHTVQKNTCDKFDPSFYPKFKKWCDDYFVIKHRNERRGLGGIFFDDLNDYDQEMLLSFATECANSVVPAYIPIIEKRKDTPFTEQNKAWQQLRRGRYVEFNLVYDRGTTFGLKTGGRIESILVSLPLTARWEYDHIPEEGSEEWKLLDACINPKDWI